MSASHFFHLNNCIKKFFWKHYIKSLTKSSHLSHDIFSEVSEPTNLIQRLLKVENNKMEQA